MEQLIIRLGADAQQSIDWAVWHRADQTVLAAGELPNADALPTLTERAAGRPITVLVPSTDVLLTDITLPPGAGRKVIQSIGFMLEDDLALEIDNQFIALGPKHNNKQSIAIVDDRKMAMWLAWLDAAQLVCQQMLPEVLALPLASELPEQTAPCSVYASITIREQILIRTGAWSGWAGESQWLVPLLSQSVQQQEQPVYMTQYTQDDAWLGQPLISTHTAELELPMHVFASEVMHQPFNLCQGQYQQKQQSNGTWQYWRSVAAVALIALGIGLVNKGLTVMTLQQQNTALSQQIKQDIQQGFPNIGSYRDARRAITQYVSKMNGVGSGVSGVEMLTQLSRAFAAANVQAQSLKFDHARTELRIQAKATSFADLDTFKTHAQAAGFTVEQGAINNRNNLVIGTLTIKG